MCGIIGYIGSRASVPVLLEGLKALEYRGYDSAGIAVRRNDGAGVVHVRRSGHVKRLEEVLKKHNTDEGTLGIGHTRWATHGVPNEVNAHPHADCSGRVFVVHNGIIENHRELRSYLIDQGHVFASDTDTEIMPHLIEHFLSSDEEFETALRNALRMVRGAYAFAVINAEDSETLYAARLSSPLVIGVGENEHFLASDPAALIGKTNNVIYLNDGEVARIGRDTISIFDLDNQELPLDLMYLEWDLEQAQKGSFSHFMLKEIFEAPDVIKTAQSGRIESSHKVKLGGLESVAERLKSAKRIVILACGTSYYAGLVGEYLLEEIANIPVEVELASEFRYRSKPIGRDTVAIAISQSGETADTLAALRKAKSCGMLTLGIVNVVDSTIARETDAGVYNHAGPEIGVASTKAFLSQLTVLALLAAYVSKDASRRGALLEELERIPQKAHAILERAAEIEALAAQYATYEDFLYIGRRYNYPVALEGALKLKEISYIHAEGYGAGEMKHGPLAMISESFPTLVLVTQNDLYEKVVSNIEEIRARKGPVIAIATEGDADIAALVDDVFYIPKTLEHLEPLLSIIPLQLFAFYVGIRRGLDVDKPRNLAKSVTVE